MIKTDGQGDKTIGNGQKDGWNKEDYSSHYSSTIDLSQTREKE